jgi:hypothetical protein
MPGNDSNTLLLIHSDTTSGSTTFVDSGAGPGCPHTITPDPNITHSTAQKKLGATSWRGTSYWGSLKIDDSNLKNVVNGNWGVDTWVYFTGAYMGGDILDLYSPQGSNPDAETHKARLNFGFDASGAPSYVFTLKIYRDVPVRENLLIASTQFTVATGWWHIELTKSGDRFYFFMDGELKSNEAWDRYLQIETEEKRQGVEFIRRKKIGAGNLVEIGKQKT